MTNPSAGRVRCRLAHMIGAALTAQGLEVSVNPERLVANKGHWRSSRYADVMPWSGVFTECVNGRLFNRTVESWGTMTILLRGFTTSRAGSTVELHACSPSHNTQETTP